MVTEAKDRVLQEGEFLFKDGTTAHYMYFLLEGALRIEKEVFVSSKNYWPIDGQNWAERMVNSKVLYKVRDIFPHTLIGEHEVVNGSIWPVQAVGSGPKTRLLMISRKDTMRSKSLAVS